MTANAHPKVIRSQSPDPRSAGPLGLAVRPDPIRAQSIATTPSPKLIRMNVPKNSAHSSPPRPFRQPAGTARTAAESSSATYPPPSTWVQGHDLTSSDVVVVTATLLADATGPELLVLHGSPGGWSLSAINPALNDRCRKRVCRPPTQSGL